MRSTEQIGHIFMEMYRVDEAMKIDYFKIKVAELLLFLQHVSFYDGKKSQNYYTSAQIETVKQIRDYLVQHINEKCDSAMLAKKFNLNIVTLRKCFKDIYGSPIYKWHKEYRLEHAKQLLIRSNLSILEIASRIGYENPSKFSSAFYSYAKEKPLNFRKKNQ